MYKNILLSPNKPPTIQSIHIITKRPSSTFYENGKDERTQTTKRRVITSRARTFCRLNVRQPATSPTTAYWVYARRVTTFSPNTLYIFHRLFINVAKII